MNISLAKTIHIDPHPAPIFRHLTFQHRTWLLIDNRTSILTMIAVCKPGDTIQRCIRCLLLIHRHRELQLKTIALRTHRFYLKWCSAFERHPLQSIQLRARRSPSATGHPHKQGMIAAPGQAQHTGRKAFQEGETSALVFTIHFFKEGAHHLTVALVAHQQLSSEGTEFIRIDRQYICSRDPHQRMWKPHTGLFEISFTTSEIVHEANRIRELVWP